MRALDPPFSVKWPLTLQFAKMSLPFLAFLNTPFHNPLWNSDHVFWHGFSAKPPEECQFHLSFVHLGPIQSRNIGSAVIPQSKANICTTPGDLGAPSLKQTYCVLLPPASIFVFLVGISRLDLLCVSPLLVATSGREAEQRVCGWGAKGKDSILKCSGKCTRASLHAPDSKHLWLKVFFKGKLFSCNRGIVLRGGSWKKGSSAWLFDFCCIVGDV